MVVRTFFTFTFCLTGSPQAGNRKIRGFQAILAQDGLLPLDKSRGWAENGKLGALLWKKPGRPNRFSLKVHTLFYSLRFGFWPTGPPRAANREIRGFWGGAFWPRKALGT